MSACRCAWRSSPPASPLDSRRSFPRTFGRRTESLARIVDVAVLIGQGPGGGRLVVGTHHRLSADQHEIMAAAAKDAVTVAMEAERAADTNAATALCKAGLTFRPVLRRRPQGIREGTRTGLRHDPQGPRQRDLAGSDRRNQAVPAPGPRQRPVLQVPPTSRGPHATTGPTR